MGLFEDKDKLNADNRIGEIISIVQEQNVDEFAAIFSATAKEENDNILSEIEGFFCNFDDTGLSYTENAGPAVDAVVKDFLANIAFSKNKILQKTSSLISAFCSVGGIVALFIDLMDKKWDNYASLRIR